MLRRARLMGNISFAGDWREWVGEVGEKTKPAQVEWPENDLVEPPKWFNRVSSVDRGLWVIWREWSTTSCSGSARLAWGGKRDGPRRNATWEGRISDKRPRWRAEKRLTTPCWSLAFEKS
jgi:hypothetical protein